jgi:hypothetical protein
MDNHEAIRHDDEAARLAPKRAYDLFNFGVIVNACCDQLYLEQLSASLKRRIRRPSLAHWLYPLCT